MIKDVKCKIASVDEMKTLWNYSQSNTYHYFVNGIENGNIEFWALEQDNKIIGELYIFWNSPDQEEANGVDRAYLCAFRVSQDHQGKGYGSLLMNRVFDRLLEKGIKEATIGVDNDDYERLNAMYQKWGFNTLVKTKEVDLHYIGKNGLPSPCESYNLLVKNLSNQEVELKVAPKNVSSLELLELDHDQTLFVMPANKIITKSKETESKLIAIDYCGESVGLMLYKENKSYSCYFIWALMIEKNHQNMGIGSKAIKQLITLFSEEEKYNKITTSVLKENENALKLFLNQGFEVVREDGEIDLELIIG